MPLKRSYYEARGVLGQHDYPPPGSRRCAATHRAQLPNVHDDGPGHIRPQTKEEPTNALVPSNPVETIETVSVRKSVCGSLVEVAAYTDED